MLIRIENVTKRFGSFVAVDNASLEIAEGEFFALLGPSGCGKTTLLRMLAGLEVPSEGRILIDGVDMAGTPPNRRPVNMVFQSYAVFPHLSVADNVAYGLVIDKVPRDERDARVAEALALVKLGSFAQRRPDQLSGGQRQRVALARALVKRPRVLLLDEPLSALDAKLRDAMRSELAAIQREVGVTFVMVTHDQDEALALASRCALMNSGRLVQVASPGELYERPASRFVADFIGSINLFAGTWQIDASDRRRIISPALPIPIAAEAGATPPSGTTIWAGVRPEKIRILPADAPPAESNSAAGTIIGSAYLGAVTLCDVRTAEGAMIKLSVPNTTPLAASELAIGRPVRLAWDAAAVVVLTE